MHKSVSFLRGIITVSVSILMVFIFGQIAFSRLGSGDSIYTPQSGSSVKDYDADPSIKWRNYEEIKNEIKDNISRIGLSPKGGKKKMVVYVWDFDNKSGYRVGSHKIKDDISTLLLETDKFKLIEDAIVEAALKEMNLSGTGLIDKSNVKELGKRIGIDYIVYGSINNNQLAGGEPNISLVLKTIDVETTEVVWSYEIGMNRRDYKTSLDAVIDESIFRHQYSLAREWDRINKESIESYGKPITTISVFFVNAGRGIDDSAVVDKMTSALIQARIPNLKVIDRANLSRVIEQISKEGYEESAFFRTKKEFGKFYGVDAFLYGVVVRDPSTGKTELNLKLAMVESVTVDWGRKFQSEMTSAEREAIGKIQQKEFSENVSKTVSATAGAVGEFLGFILSAPGIGVRLSGGWLGGFTTPAMTSKSLYNNNDIFKDSLQLSSFNVSIDFFRLRIWRKTYIDTGIKFWIGSYTTSEDEGQLRSASFNGRLPYISLRNIVDDVFFVRASLMPLIDGISVISSKVSYNYPYTYGYYIYTISNTVEVKVPDPNATYSSSSPLNWPFEFETGVSLAEGGPPYLSIVFGLWFPGEYGNNKSDLEWEFGINMVVPIFWWHPFSFLYDKYLENL
ncbi:MAG: CsgG/HfaB family protein [Spirochaetia bacterium]|nr:penicillin-binding protein activator LpoB [Spirochaetota bacterium]MDW8112158.1 CsgG/HfaB family protein [Spirochaetia bacterium]